MRPFDAASLERRYAFIEALPESLVDAVVPHPVGTLPERVAGVLAWREALLAGRLPPPDAWPPAPLAEPARRALEAMGIARFCKGEDELVDALLRDILAAIAREEARFRSRVLAELRRLEALERRRREEEEAEWAELMDCDPRPVVLDEETLARLRAEAERLAAGAGGEPDAALLATWAERARAWAAVAEVFGDLGSLLGRGWDLARGVLRHAGWTELVRLRALVEQLPEFREVVRSLGRLQASDAEETTAERIFEPVLRVEEERREVRAPHVPAETRGVERGGEIARMLPAEAVLLGHPKLRLLWHARRAERALLSYRVEGTEVERVEVERETREEREARRPRPERGPIVAVIDTSGSMHGLPERIAKALVLEAVRVAHSEGRPCFLYAYGGPGEVLEHELDLGPEGIGRLLDFLGFSFGGGTDIGALAAVARRLETEAWKKADVLLVTDGEWSAPRAIVSAVKGARERGCRFHGVQVGARGRTGLHELCDPVHVFARWAELAGW